MRHASRRVGTNAERRMDSRRPLPTPRAAPRACAVRQIPDARAPTRPRARATVDAPRPAGPNRPARRSA